MLRYYVCDYSARRATQILDAGAKSLTALGTALMVTGDVVVN